MKTNKKRMILFGWIAVSLMLFAFRSPTGGDSFQVYFKGQLMLEQFVHMDKSLKTLDLSAASENDKVDVYYYHCGQVGRDRFLTIKDDNGKSLHVWQYSDAPKENAAMSFRVKDVTPFLKSNDSRFTVTYSSKELPNGRPIATINLGNMSMAKK